ncbi:MAG: NAD(P)H-dependent oxidoreductase [Candidatus Korobacteraceae bacterium]
MTSGTNAGRIVLLDGTPGGDESHAPILTILRDTLAAGGAEVQAFALRDMKLAHCIGCFGCWIETPGICVQADAAREIAAAIVHSEMLVLFTPVTFGGYSPELKVMVDRFVQLTLPYFISYHREMHHPPRYVPMPRLVAVGVQRQTSHEEASIFKTLAGRNALNFHAPSHAAEVVSLGDDADAIRDRIQALLSRSDPCPMRDVVTALLPLPQAPIMPVAHGAARRALLIVGSPKVKRPSTSGVLGGYLLERLKQNGWETQSSTLRAGLRREEEQAKLLTAVDTANLLILAFPLYIDSLPFLMTKALQVITKHRLENPNRLPQSVVAISNNGFIEAHQNNVALAICHQFAKQSQIAWAGALAMGAGEALSSGQPLRPPLARYAIKALSITADALSKGHSVPHEAATLIGKSPFPTVLWRWLFARVGTSTFQRQASANGLSRKQMVDRPYAQSARISTTG